MSSFKRLTRQDVYISDYTSNRRWSFDGELALDGIGVQYLQGYRESLGGLPYPQDLRNGRHTTLTWRNINQMYYADSTGLGTYTGSRDMHLQTTLTISQSRDISDSIMIVAMPQNVVGTHITRRSFVLAPSSGSQIDNYIEMGYTTDHCGMDEYFQNNSTIYGTKLPPDNPDYILDETDHTGADNPVADAYVEESNDAVPGQYVSSDTGDYQRPEIIDDGEGHLVFSGSEVSGFTDRRILGDIIYPHGLAVVTDREIADFYTSFSRGSLQWRSNQPIYTLNAYCRVQDSEFNATYNPSAVQGTDARIKPHLTGSDFSPYITTVGLYNEANELLVVGKLNRPIKKSQFSDTNILVRLDL